MLVIVVLIALARPSPPQLRRIFPGCEIAESETAEEALRLASERDFHVIIMDEYFGVEEGATLTAARSPTLSKSLPRACITPHP